MAAAATERRFARNRRCAAFAEPSNLPRLHTEGLHDAVPGDGLVEDVLHVGKLILSSAGGGADTAADAHRGKNDDWDEDDENPGKLASEDNDQSGGKQEGEELLKEFGEDARHRELHALDVVDDGGNQSAGSVLLEK